MKSPSSNLSWSYRIACVVLLGALLSCSESTSDPIRAAAAQADSGAAEPSDGSVLPFPPTPSASIAKRTMQESTHHRRKEPRRLPADAPNILIVLLDDVGPGLPDTYGGEIHTPTLSRIAKKGISYNRFHSTAMCSPTRAALLTGRNHHRVASGQITEFANDWDGYHGVMPRTCATSAEVLKCYGYSTSAFGKWHNTPANETTSQGPFHNWPTGLGFEHFYGFLAGEASQWEPRLVKNTTLVDPEIIRRKGVHLSEDLAENAIEWLREQQAFEPDKPFFMYWAPGAVHGPHHVSKEWADKYKGKFDDGWDKYRERTFQRQKELGWIPKDAELTPRPDTLAGWDSIPEAEKPFQRRLMELFAGFAEHTDHQVGRLIDELERVGRLENTIVFYIWGDNGSSAEGQNGSISELLAQNGIPSRIEQHIKALDELGGLDVLGSPKTDNMYHAGWAWAGSTPYKSTKLVAGHFGGTRQPMAVSWPKRIKPDATPRSQFHHVNDIVPTLYEILKITPPKKVNGVPQDVFDGVSLAYSFGDAKAPGRKTSQYFEIMGSRGIYHDEWFACVFGPRVPWEAGVDPKILTWNPDNDVWELYNLKEDWSQARDLAKEKPEKLAELKALFDSDARKNKVYPVGGGLYTVLRPQEGVQIPSDHWKFEGAITGMPEFSAPKLGTRSNLVTIEAEFPAEAEGVLFALGGFSGGLTCYLDKGFLCYEYNLFEISRFKVRSQEKVPAGQGQVEVEFLTKPIPNTRGHSGEVLLRVNGKEAARLTVPLLASFAFTANDALDFGVDLGSPVGIDYHDRAPFRFTGKILSAEVRYKN